MAITQMGTSLFKNLSIIILNSANTDQCCWSYSNYKANSGGWWRFALHSTEMGMVPLSPIANTTQFVMIRHCLIPVLANNVIYYTVIILNNIVGLQLIQMKDQVCLLPCM